MQRSSETAGLAAALLSSGAAPEVAATALKNMTNALTKGEGATKSQRKAFQMLGFDTEALAKRMTVDAKGAISDVFAALAEAPEQRKSYLLSSLFGEEAKGALAPLLVNLDNLKKGFGLVASETSYAGSMQAEYDARSATTANALQLMSNATDNMSSAFGALLLPAIRDGAEMMSSFAKRIQTFVEENPTLARIIGYAAAGFAGLAMAAGVVGSAVAGILGTLAIAKFSMTALGLTSAGAGKSMVALARSALVTSGRLALSLVTSAGRATVSVAAFGARAILTAMRSLPALGLAAGRAGLAMGASMMSGAGSAVAAIGRFGGTALSLALTIFPKVGMAFRALSAAFMTNPIGLIVGGIALAAGFLIMNWDKVPSWFDAALTWVWDKATWLWDNIRSWAQYTPIGAIKDLCIISALRASDFLVG